MLKKTCIAAGTVLALAAGTAAFAHDTPGTGWISKDAAMAKVKAQGYDAVRLEGDDGRWKGEATKQGLFYDIHVDPALRRVDEERIEALSLLYLLYLL